MTLQELLNRHGRRPAHGVPDWMLGCFRRRCISFAHGDSDCTTLVYWIQSRNFTIDLRLPQPSDQAGPAAPEDRSAAELAVLANYEGWAASCAWDGQQLSWLDETSLQVRSRWPEPARLHRIGNCMIEFAPSGAYVEDWRLQPSQPGPLAGLRLLEERDADTGECLHSGGGLIVCGDYAALVRGRPAPLEPAGPPLPRRVAQAEGNPAHLFSFETSVARGAIDRGYRVEQSTCPGRRGQALIDLSGFEWLENSGRVRQLFRENDRWRERWFEVDTLERQCDFSLHTETSAAARDWFAQESATLTRYTEVLS